MFVNPKAKNTDDFTTKWAQKVKTEITYGDIPHTIGELQVINDDGLFVIPWPKATNEDEISLDFILATATKPTLENGKYPGAAEIVKAWENNPQYACYFWNNREWGIETFQDNEIKNWLDC